MHTALTVANKAELPAARNENAEALLAHIDRFAVHFSNRGGFDFLSWAGACVMEVNRLTKPCKTASVLMSVLHSARMSMPPGAPYGLCYFVPFKGQCQFIPGYQGMLELAYSTNFLSVVQAGVALEGEQFDHGFDTMKHGHYVYHPIDVNNRMVTWENITASYCYYETVRGGRNVVVMGKPELAKLRKPSGPWKDYPAEMCKKTAIRRAAKLWQKVGNIALAVDLDEKHEIGEVQEVNLPEDIAGHGLSAGNLTREMGRIAAADNHETLSDMSIEFSSRDDLNESDLVALDYAIEQREAQVADG